MDMSTDDESSDDGEIENEWDQEEPALTKAQVCYSTRHMTIC